MDITMNNSFVIKGNICQTINSKELDLHENAYAVCVNGISKGVFEVLPEEYTDLPLYDYGDTLIFPGMVDLHVHAPQYAFRGMCMDLELMDWLNRYTFPEEEKYENIEYAEKAYAMFVDAMKKGATTRACIFATRHRPATELLMKLMEESGLVSYVGKVNMDREASEALTEESADISAFTTFGWINAVKDKFRNTMPILTPRFIPCCTDELMEELREIQMAYGIPVQSHLSESKGEIEFVKFLRPGDPFYGDSYNDYDLFGKNDDIDTDVKTVMAHCVWSDMRERSAMHNAGVTVVHCPDSNQNLCSGIAPVRTMLHEGLNVTLGSDIAGGDHLNMFDVIAASIRASKSRYILDEGQSEFLSVSEGWYLGTSAGASYFGEQPGFAVGNTLHAIVLTDDALPQPHSLTPMERLERCVYRRQKNAIRAVWSAGRKVYVADA